MQLTVINVATVNYHTNNINNTYFVYICTVFLGFPGGSDGKESACNAKDLVSILGLERSPEGGHSNPLWYSCPENPMDRGGWWATVHGVAKSQAD